MKGVPLAAVIVGALILAVAVPIILMNALAPEHGQRVQFLLETDRRPEAMEHAIPLTEEDIGKLPPSIRDAFEKALVEGSASAPVHQKDLATAQAVFQEASARLDGKGEGIAYKGVVFHYGIATP